MLRELPRRDPLLAVGHRDPQGLRRRLVPELQRDRGHDAVLDVGLAGHARQRLDPDHGRRAGRAAVPELPAERLLQLLRPDRRARDLRRHDNRDQQQRLEPHRDPGRLDRDLEHDQHRGQPARTRSLLLKATWAGDTNYPLGASDDDVNSSSTSSRSRQRRSRLRRTAAEWP